MGRVRPCTAPNGPATGQSVQRLGSRHGIGRGRRICSESGRFDRSFEQSTEFDRTKFDDGYFCSRLLDGMAVVCRRSQTGHCKLSRCKNAKKLPVRLEEFANRESSSLGQLLLITAEPDPASSTCESCRLQSPRRQTESSRGRKCAAAPTGQGSHPDRPWRSWRSADRCRGP